MTKPWEITKASFYAPSSNPGPPPELWFGFQSEVDGVLARHTSQSRVPLAYAPGYSYLETADGELIAVEDATGAAVAAYFGETLMTSPSHGGRNIGASLVVVLFNRAPWNTPQEKFSDLGARTLRRAHALEVCSAFVRGEDIPDTVRAEYGLPLRRT